MSLMSKLLTIWISSAVLIFAAGDLTTEQKIDKFLSTSIKPNKNIKVMGYKIAKTVDISKKIPGWKAYIILIDLKLLKQNNRLITIKDVLFSNGTYISRQFVNLKTKKKIKDEILRDFSPDADSSYYDKKHLLYGSSNAKYKLLVFSDPQCPFCMDFVPDLMEFVKKHPKDFALYYYHMPLSFHPGSDTIVKALIAAGLQGKKDLEEKVYSADFEMKKHDPKSILDRFNKELDTNVTLADIKKKEVLDRFSEDLYKSNKLLINGTPTIFINGKYDKGREKIEKLMKEYKDK
ncbi:MAG: DsbA family protein [Epsilonproteobacteria bacterium]|nr:DsbA family protein [Campylobacterota bacterium]